MRKIMMTLAAGVVIATPAMAEKYFGELVHVISGSAMPAAFELLDATRLSYCFQDVEKQCYDMDYRLDKEVIEIRLEIEREVDGVKKMHTNIWSFAPIEGGYHGRFSIAYEDAEPVLQTQGEFFPR